MERSEIPRLLRETADLYSFLHWCWSGRADLNRRPLGPEPSALAGLSHAPSEDIIREGWRFGKRKLNDPHPASPKYPAGYLGEGEF